MNLLQQFLSASQDFRDLMLRQEKQDEKLEEIEGKIQGGGGEKITEIEEKIDIMNMCIIKVIVDANATKVLKSPNIPPMVEKAQQNFVGIILNGVDMTITPGWDLGTFIKIKNNENTRLSCVMLIASTQNVYNYE